MACGKCCQDLVIDPLHLMFPEQLSPIGHEFVYAHGLDHETLINLRRGATINPDGKVRIQHVCQHLTHEHLCDIYEARPQLCRDFDCSTRADRTCGTPAESAVPLVFRRMGAVN